MRYPGPPQPSGGGPARRPSRGKIVAIVAAVVALVAAVAVGRASIKQDSVQPAAAPAPATVTVTVTVTVTAEPSTVTSTRAPETVTADPTTVTAPPVTVTQTETTTEAAAGPTATIKNGISIVGTDIQPGTYRSENDNCYWARLSGTSGTLDDIIANSNGATVVTINSSDMAFESRYCAPWTHIA